MTCFWKKAEVISVDASSIIPVSVLVAAHPLLSGARIINLLHILDLGSNKMSGSGSIFL